jgi:ubiquinone/menaquinone biosynthesis C-methylase UbiE
MTTDKFSYEQYVTDDSFTEKYQEYQSRYAAEPRESDKVIIRLVRALVAEAGAARTLKLLDIGCSTGNLLSHLKRHVPEVELAGGDMVPSILDECRRNPELGGIAFRTTNIVELGIEAEYDIITVNAVLYMLDDAQFAQSLANVARALRPGGALAVFDFFHEFKQDLAILEKSRSHPDGLMLHFRPQAQTTRVLEAVGFGKARYMPFEIPIDLARGQTAAANRDGFEDLNSYTVKDEAGARMLFRGTLFQPWCHLLAHKV